MKSKVTKGREAFSPVSVEITFESIVELAYVCALFNKSYIVFSDVCRDAFDPYPEGLDCLISNKSEIWRTLDKLYNDCNGK